MYRFVGMLKYLPRSWKPTVLTVEEQPGDVLDASLLEGFPEDVEIVRTPQVSFERMEGAPGMKAAAATLRGSHDATPPLWYRGARRLAEWFRSVVYFPDALTPWIPVAVKEAARLHRRRRFDLVYTSSPPRSTVLVGFCCKVLLRLPWVVEFRDPWYPAPSRLRAWLERKLLRLLLRSSDQIVANAEGIADELANGYSLPRERISVISNGFDEAQFKGVASKASMLPAGFFHLTHFGTVYPRNCGEFFPAVGELLEQEPELAERVRINIVGENFDPEVSRLAGSNGWKNVLRTYPFIPQPEALREMQHSDCLLLFLARPEMSRLSGLGKIFWYLRAGRPVLAIAPEGGCRTLVETAGAGWAVNPRDRAEIVAALRAILASRDQSWPKRPDYLVQFRYENLAKRLGDVLDAAVADG